ncbi:MAG TPA: hypothetical protein VIF15_15950 [Polyangiaceae bacterium]|jgi:hypothetical protein
MQKVAPDFDIRPGEAALDAPLAGGRAHPGGFGLGRRLADSVVRATDGQLALLLSAALFLFAAWPLALVDVPPFQDLPNHLAVITVLQHPDRYPEFVFNGFFKTNSALFTWLLLVGRVVGTRVAAKLFVLLVLALGSIAFPRFVLSFAGRRRMLVSALFVWPLVHNWFVSMGMLDFALGVPLATLMLVALNAQRQRPTVARGVAIALLAVVTWHAHAFPLLVVHLLVAVHVMTRRTWPERWSQARALLLPLVPSSALLSVSLWVHFTEPAGAMTGFVDIGRHLPPWELFYNLWAEWFYAFTWLEIATLVPCVAMGLWALYRWRTEVPFFGPVAFAVLGAFYFFSPYIATNWFHVNTRFIPFLWLAAMVRLPERLPRRAAAVLGACALATTVGMGVDYVRLERDWSRFTAGMGVVPEGSRLLPLIFRSKATSENTRSILHAWGFYVTEKQTSAPLLFAHSRSFPLMYREPPPPQFNHLVLESFAPSMASPEWMCDVQRSGGVVVDDCDAQWRERWAEFWQAATPRFDHVLMWQAPKDVMGLVPVDYAVVFQRDELTILERRAPAPASTPAGR